MMGARQIMREGFRQALMRAAKYNVEIVGEFPKSTPDKPFMVAMYPHNEHANSLVIPQVENLAYMAAHDHFFKNPIQLLTLMAWLTTATIPVVRKPEDQGPSAFKNLNKDVEKAFGRGQKVGIYPQGTRSGTYATPDLLAEAMIKNKGAANISHRFQAPVIPVGFLYPPEYQPQKGGVSGEKRIFARLRGEDIDPVTVKVVVGEPIPAMAERKNGANYMSGLAFILWGMVHGGEEIARLPNPEPFDLSTIELNLSGR